ncbi:spherulation-specific family 4 protein [Kineosporia sp. NBRC 101731]|uniref:spherulation-specific family 4 protein n=1 Tax=Kineosporia sp. NBRC 101731 TaxID=3032199 RepID=UPI0024A23EB8|nr:spherulation-specific family 4 protein [Kineosporia sp. NBRC 101731]GLY28913.1 hypothetical protein Kisp02_22780 [Kineosporia sp. NBRC 101731]
MLKKRGRSLSGRIVALTIALGASLFVAQQPASAAATDLEQKVGIPAYIPTSDTAAWNALKTSGAALGFAVANVSNGPGSSTADAGWASAISGVHTAGTKVLGYVDTGYFGVTDPARKTRLGESTKTAWLVQAEQDIDRWYSVYGASVDGIFFDDGLNTCGPTSGSNEYADLYAQLDAYVHDNHPGALTVVNPGVAVPQCYEDSADVLLTFEGTYTDFLATTRPAQYQTAQWQLDGDPNQFLELIYDVPTTTALQQVITRSKADNAGYVYVTPDTLPNPWDTVPATAYWQAELAATQVTATTTPATPAKPSAGALKGTSLTLSWASSTSSGVAGYDVYQGTTKIGSVANGTPANTEFDVTGLKPATTYSFTVKARHYDASVSAASPALSVTTPASGTTLPGAPGGVTATQTKSTSTQLTWTYPTSGNGGDITNFRIYDGSALILDVPDSVLSVHIGDLDPGTTHSFTVKAVDASGSVSAASTAVTVTTTNPTPITAPAVTHGSTTTTLSASFNLPYGFQHVFVDTDGSATTGYYINGIGAEYMIETSSAAVTLYSHAGAVGDWNWTSVLTPGLTTTANSTGTTYTWSVPSSTFGSATQLSVVFNGSGAYTDYNTTAVTG